MTNQYIGMLREILTFRFVRHKESGIVTHARVSTQGGNWIAIDTRIIPTYGTEHNNGTGEYHLFPWLGLTGKEITDEDKKALRFQDRAEFDEMLTLFITPTVETPWETIIRDLVIVMDKKYNSFIEKRKLKFTKKDLSEFGKTKIPEGIPPFLSTCGSNPEGNCDLAIVDMIVYYPFEEVGPIFKEFIDTPKTLLPALKNKTLKVGDL